MQEIGPLDVALVQRIVDHLNSQTAKKYHCDIAKLSTASANLKCGTIYNSHKLNKVDLDGVEFEKKGNITQFCLTTYFKLIEDGHSVTKDKMIVNCTIHLNGGHSAADREIREK